MIYVRPRLSFDLHLKPPQTPATLVMKFGGTSVGTPEAMAAGGGDHPPHPPGLAQGGGDHLGSFGCDQPAAGQRLTGRHRPGQQLLHRRSAACASCIIAIAEQLVSDLARRAQVKQDVGHLISDFLNLCQAIAVLGEATPRALDAVAALGERMSVRLLAAALDSAGVPAQYVEATQLIVTDRNFQNAHPDLEATQQRSRLVLDPILDLGRVPVVTGFIGATPEGITTTLGRGGSDYSAGILGAVLPADDVWIWTDVDGVMSADPRAVPSARTISELTYREIAELAYFGAKVLHPKTIRPVIDAGIGLRICNTFNPDHPGTRLVADREATLNGDVKAVTAIRGQRLITIEGRGMLGVPGVAARTFGAVASTGTSVPLITQASSEQSICFAVPSGATEQVISRAGACF